MIRRGHRRGRIQPPVLASELMACLLGAVMSQLVYNGPSSFGAQNACIPAAPTTREPGNVIRRR
jgi:hypothetical protein